MSAAFQGFEGGGAPSQAAGENTSASDVSDTATACLGASSPCTPPDGSVDVPAAVKARRRGSPRLTTRYDEATLEALRTRAQRLGVDPSAWVRSVVRDALDHRRTEELDAIVGAALLEIESRAQATADVQHLAAQVRPLAININDLDARARSGQPVTLGPDVAELVEVLREVRELLGDRVAS